LCCVERGSNGIIKMKKLLVARKRKGKKGRNQTPKNSLRSNGGKKTRDGNALKIL